MNNFAFKQDAPGHRSSVGSSWVSCDELGVFTRISVARFEIVSFTLWPTYDYCVRLAQPGSRMDERIEHGLQIKGRAADDLEHVGGGGLLLKRFAQFVEKAGILNRDCCLIGEGFDQLDLFFGERPHASALQVKDADRHSFTH